MSDESHHEDEYDDAMVTMLEFIWGEGFLAPGGPEAALEIVRGLDLDGKLVLDIGCGVGGPAVVLARERGCRVIGLDVEGPLIARARARAERAGLADRTDFHTVEPGPLPLADASVDVVFNKDSGAHIKDKPAFFAETFRVLRPGGALTVSDWMRGPEPYSRDMEYWFKMEGLTYHMETLEGIAAVLGACGFTDVETTDTSALYRAQAHDEHERMQGPLYARMGELLGPEKRAHFIEDWRAMTIVLDKGELRTGRLRARKPD
ncbi:MAG: methyltransferase domain-containing protein [Alphaproteobacteria bacterium]